MLRPDEKGDGFTLCFIESLNAHGRIANAKNPPYVPFVGTALIVEITDLKALGELVV
jgi:hypothetical protein